MQFMVGGNITTTFLQDLAELKGAKGPAPVVQVSPDLKPGYTFMLFFLSVGALFLKAWIVMLILGALTPLGFGYWQSMLLVIGTDMLIKSPNRMLHNITSLKGK